MVKRKATRKTTTLKKLIIKRNKSGFITSVENPNMKKGKSINLVQTSNFTGFTPVDKKTGRRIKTIKRGRTETSALTNAIRTKGIKKVIVLD